MNGAKKIGVVFLVVLFISYYASMHFFTHTHSYEWGEVTHSHPYTSDTHTHCTTALQLIENLSTWLVIGMLGTDCMALSVIPKELCFFSRENYVLRPLIGGNQLRAPPVGA
jgi:hypothetical protein